MTYTATFDSDRPERGVVIDEERSRYCTFPSLEQAASVAERWNGLPADADPPVIWRSTVTGGRIEPGEAAIELEVFLWGWYDRVAGHGESWTFSDLAEALTERYVLTPREVTP